MTLFDLCEILNKGIEIPIALGKFKTPTPLPFIIIKCDGEETIKADNTVLLEFPSVRIELYSSYKDIELETKIKNILKENEIEFEVSDIGFIESEKMYGVVYDFVI